MTATTADVPASPVVCIALAKPHEAPRARTGWTDVLATVFLLTACMALPVAIVSSRHEQLVALIWILAIMLVTLLLHEWLRLGHPLTPAGVLAASGLLLFVLRPLTIISNGSTSPGAAADSQRFSGEVVDAAVSAQGQVVLFFAVAGVLFLHLVRQQPSLAGHVKRVFNDGEIRRARVLLIGAAALATACAALLIHSSGGLTQHLGGLSVRSSFLAGRFFLTLGYVPLAVALCLNVLARRSRSDLVTWDLPSVCSAAVLIASAFATGARGPLLLGAVLPLLLLKQAGPRRLSSLALVVYGFVLVVAAMLISLTLRENKYDGGASFTALRGDFFGTLMTRMTSGAETRPFDSLILLNQMMSDDRIAHRLGSTYLTVITWFVPGSLLDSKSGGANTWFTISFLPRFYYPHRIETSISAIGEGFANFGYFGVIIAAAAVGLAAARIGLSPHAQSTLSILLAVSLTPLFFSFLRGDAYQNLPLIIIVTVCAVAMERVVRASDPPLVTSQDMAIERAGTPPTKGQACR